MIGGWVALYPSSNDPKNIRYVLWKAHLLAWDLDLATYALAFDPDRNGLVLGKTKSELEGKFG